jgi:hypothetical protein
VLVAASKHVVGEAQHAAPQGTSLPGHVLPLDDELLLDDELEDDVSSLLLSAAALCASLAKGPLRRACAAFVAAFEMAPASVLATLPSVAI